ncbi:MAG: hypothetical protein V1836_03170 [Candidatus Aenigmatarchaeota archaeon]
MAVTHKKQATFITIASDNVGVSSCTFEIETRATAVKLSFAAAYSNGAASYVHPGLQAGTYSAYFTCKDTAGNNASGETTAITSEKSQLKAALTLEKENFYPKDSVESRIKVTDVDGKIITDATIEASMAGPTNKGRQYFYYSTLCDCYKAWTWFSESDSLGDYELKITVKHSDYDNATLSKTVKLLKPVLNLVMKSDKTEYNPSDSIQLEIAATDKEGNSVTDAYLTGDIRDASTGALVSTIYPWKKESKYVYSYWVSADSLGKSLIITVQASWKEQKSNSTLTISITKRGLNADVVLEKDVLIPGDNLNGKVKVFDKDGNTISDAIVSAELYDENGNYQRYISAKYEDGFYYLDPYKIQEWAQMGEYKLKMKISKGTESITVEKKITIQKEKLNVEINFDEPSYRPGDRMYLQILVTKPDGSVVQDAFVSGNIFPLNQETRKIEGYEGTPQVCRLYVSPKGPIYYKGDFVQKYYVEDVYISDWCPTGKYVLELSVGKGGYADAKITKEFDVNLGSISLESGFKISTQGGKSNLDIYAEAKDSKGKIVQNAEIKGFLHPLNGTGCLKELQFWFDTSLSRHRSSTFLSKSECPEGDYTLELKASSRSFETANITKVVEIKYEKGYEHDVFVPAASGTPAGACKEVSCGPNCVQTVCGTPTPTISEPKVVDKACLQKCENTVNDLEKESLGQSSTSLENCIQSCYVTKQTEATIKPSDIEAMKSKLEQIQIDVSETKEKVGAIENLLKAILAFVRSFLGSTFLTAAPSSGITVNTTAAIG